jgi:hypothetical protein
MLESPPVRSLATLFVVLIGCSGSSSELASSSCDAADAAADCQTFDCDAGDGGACQAIANEIISAVPPGTSSQGICNHPTGRFVQACADYAQCIKQCGQTMEPGD